MGEPEQGNQYLETTDERKTHRGGGGGGGGAMQIVAVSAQVRNDFTMYVAEDIHYSHVLTSTTATYIAIVSNLLNLQI